jgi:hypothetical protein
MSNKKLAILGIIAAVMLVWAVVQSNVSSRSPKVTSGPAYLVSGVNIDDINSIDIKSGNGTVKLARHGDTFVVVNKSNYPAKTSTVNELLNNCLDIKVLPQIVTDNPANHADLGVTEEKAQTVIKFIKPDSSILVGILIGKTKENGSGTYVRLTSGNTVYVTADSPFVDSDAINYVDKQLCALTRTDTELVTVSSPDGKYVLKPVTDSENVELVNIPAGKSLKQSEAKSVFTALSSLNFTDVMKKTSDLKFDRQYKCRLFNSTEFTFDIASKDGKTYVACRAVFTDKIPVPNANEKLSPEQLKENENKMKLDEKADDFAKRHLGWVYEIPAYSAKNMTKELADLVEDRKEPEITKTPDPNAILNNIQHDQLPPGE